MDDYNPNALRITGGNNIEIETLPDGYRVHAASKPSPEYRGFFQVRPYPSYLIDHPSLTVQVLNGLLPYEEALTKPAGYVLVDRIYCTHEENNDPKLTSCRRRVNAQAQVSLSVDRTSVVYLIITAFNHSSSYNCYPELDGSKVTFRCDYKVLDKEPENDRGRLNIPLAQIDFDKETGTFSVTQLSWGIPTGTIAGYDGSPIKSDSDQS